MDILSMVYLPPKVMPWYPFVIVKGVSEAEAPFGSPDKLTEPEKKEKERVVKGMKKSKKDFKKRYGDDAESVMYATATKIAKDKKWKWRSQS